MWSIEILIQAWPSFPSYTFILFGAELENEGLIVKRYYLINKFVRGKYLSLFFGAMISLDAKRDRQSR